MTTKRAKAPAPEVLVSYQANPRDGADETVVDVLSDGTERARSRRGDAWADHPTSA